ncbi:sugar ABC transporter substrate-binding protein [Phycicoccus flavus]|uniref:sugar ABC transporter substrate-binding protein n=1 Tax=Phycicoccus flavus TaxID=2502783 RepID=UPI000FEBA907|nr:extracellular solute-binding protein [Phycicoccus flavus]NHA68620.1 extracellular solute-binding protein [Phycicoccus flavus]NHA68681.1 extracellular solute-binding protein [Phycicoccus flavus]
MNTTRTVRRSAALLLVAALSTTVAACGSDDSASSGGGSSAAVTNIGFWDPYPQYDDSSDWAKYVQACAPEGATITRTAAPNTDLINNLTTAVKEDNAPEVVFLDNPAVPEASASGLLVPIDEVGIAASDADPNLAGPGTVDGKTYGVPLGANTLGLYYNEKVLKDAGVDPSGITDWASLNAALEKVTGAGHKGITFAGIPGEEGTFQFLPWFWGAGANLKDIGSPEAVAAGQLVSDWIGKGYAPKSAITDNQSASWDLFLTGDYGFAENGSWFAKSAADEKFPIAMMPIPAKDGGAAPVPTGGEFGVVPLHKENAQAHYAAAKAVIDCLLSSDNQVKTDNMLGYFTANQETRTEQIAAEPVYTSWTDAIDNAQGRTTDLGTAYLQTSAALSKAEQAALNAAGDAGQVKSAFEAAAQETQG